MTTYYRFAMGPDSVVTDVAGNTISGRTLTVWDALTGGSQVTDLRDLAGAPLASLVTDVHGRFPFEAPDTSNVYWVDDGQNPRWPLVAVEAFASVGIPTHTHPESQVTSLTTDLGLKLAKASNLSDVASASTARTNLGLATVAASGSASDLTAGTLALARQPNVVVGWLPIVTATSNIGTTETVVQTLAGVTLTNGRAYEFVLDSQLLFSTTAAIARVMVRRTNISGSIWIRYGDLPAGSTATTSISVPYSVRRIITCTGTLTTTLVITLQNSGASGTVALNGSSTSVAGHFMISDIGPSSSFAGVNAVS